MHWWVSIKVLGVILASFGPYEDQKICEARKVEMYLEGMQRYQQGERYYVSGLEVKPSHVKMECKLK